MSLDLIISKLSKNIELPTESEVKELCQKAKELLVEESNIQRVDTPVTVNQKRV